MPLKPATANGRIHGYASLFDVRDKDQDIVKRGAFQKSLRAWQLHGRCPKMLWQHQVAEPIGVWTHLNEDGKGLYVEGQLNLQTQQGAEAQALLKQGAIEGLSIGFRPLKSRKSPGMKSRHLLDVDLLEISLVTFAANPLARVYGAGHLNRG